MNKYQLIIIFLLIFILVLPAGAFKERFTYNDLSDLKDTGYYSFPFGSDIGSIALINNRNRIGFVPDVGGLWFPFMMLNMSGSTAGELFYIAWTQEVKSDWCQLDIYDSSHNLIDDGLFNPAAGAPDGARIELKRIGTFWNVYTNGHYADQIINTPTSAYYFRLYFQNGKIDNLIVGDVDTNIIGGLPDGWYIRRDMLSPLAKGLYNNTGNNMDTNLFDVDFAVGTAGDYLITLKHILSGATINTTQWTATYTNETGLYGGLGKNLTYYIDTTFIDTSAPYGMYEARLETTGGGLLDSTYFWYLATGADIEWDRETYAPSDRANVTSVVSAGYWDPATYSYEGRIYDLYGTLMDSWTVSTQTYMEDVDLTGYTIGDYYAALVAKDGSGTEYYMDVDIATVEDLVRVEGLTLNAQTAGLLSGTTVGMLQGSTWQNTTASGGIYNLTNFTAGAPILVDARYAPYNFTSFSWTPLAAGTYNITLVLVPPVMGNASGSSQGSINGVVYEKWSHNPIANAVVRASNTTYTGVYNTTNAAGYYEFHELAAARAYRLNATSPGYVQNTEYWRSPIVYQIITQNIELTPRYLLGVSCKDDETGTLITDSCSVALSDGQSYITTTGFAPFYLDYGAYSVVGSVDGYYDASTTVLMTRPRNVTLSFTRTSEASTGAGIAYPPHQVRFTVKNLWGAPLEGIKVTAQGYETTAGSWDWLKSLLGMDLDSAPIHNATMEGYTGRDGAIVFMMIENVKYEMAITNATQGVSSTYEVYPKDDYYEIWVTTGDTQWWSTGYDAMEEINISVTKVRLNSTYGHINITYKDALVGTTNVDIYINQSDKTGVDKPDTIVDGSLGIASSDFTASFLVPADDDSYFVVFGITHSTFGKIVRTFSVIWEKVQVGIGVPSSWLMYMAVFFILFTGMFFGAITSPTVGAVITCFVGWVMWSIGWLAEMGAMAPTALVFATVISVLSVVMTRSRKERYL